MGEIEEEYEITQLFDRVLTNQNGINPLLGRYVFQCQAVRRTPSHEEFKKDENEILNELEQDVNLTDDLQESHLPEYDKENAECQENQLNNLTNQLAKNIYQYTDQADYTYGGYNTYPIDKTKTKKQKKK